MLRGASRRRGGAEKTKFKGGSKYIFPSLGDEPNFGVGGWGRSEI